MLLLAGIPVVALLYHIIAGFPMLHLIHDDIIDTATYISAGEQWAHGEMAWLRTPVYPLLVYAMRSVCGDYGVMAVQFVMFVLSAMLFHRVLELMSEKKVVVFALAALYAWSFPIYSYVACIMTENISLAGEIVLLYLAVRAFRGEAGIKESLLMGVVMILLIFTRPYYICFLPAMFIMVWLLRRRLSLCCNIIILCGMLAAVALYAGYCKAYEEKYGIYGSSAVPVINLSYQLDKLGLIENPAYLLNKADFNVKAEHDRNMAALRQHRAKWLAGELKATYTNMREQIPVGMIGHRVGLLQNLMTIHLSAGMWTLIVIAFIVASIRRGLRGSDVRLQAVLAILYISGLLTAIWGSFSYECGRLMLPCYPILLMITNDLINNLYKQKQTQLI